MHQSRNKPWLRNHAGFRLVAAPVLQAGVLGRAMAASRTLTMPARPVAVGMRDLHIPVLVGEFRDGELCSADRFYSLIQPFNQNLNGF